MNIDLSQDQIQFILSEVVSPLKKYDAQIYIFGSRANGSAQEFSDLDVLIELSKDSKEFRESVSLINERLIESNFIYKVDLVVCFDLIDTYKSQIDKEKIEVR